jgi:hypothetical protein
VTEGCLADDAGHGEPGDKERSILSRHSEVRGITGQVVCGEIVRQTLQRHGQDEEPEIRALERPYRRHGLLLSYHGDGRPGTGEEDARREDDACQHGPADECRARAEALEQDGEDGRQGRGSDVVGAEAGGGQLLIMTLALESDSQETICKSAPLKEPLVDEADTRGKQKAAGHAIQEALRHDRLYCLSGSQHHMFAVLSQLHGLTVLENAAPSVEATTSTAPAHIKYCRLCGREPMSRSRNGESVCRMPWRQSVQIVVPFRTPSR